MIDAVESVRTLLARIDEFQLHTTGRFLHQNGEPLPWWASRQSIAKPDAAATSAQWARRMPDRANERVLRVVRGST
jgi:hypothetical protein